MTVVMVLAIMPTNLQAVTEKGKTTVVAAKTADSPEEIVLTARLAEIQAMDMSTLNSVQKSQLRHEMRSIKGTLNQMNGGIIYISAGGLILIIILVIILL